jgi:hypothetical protein
MHATLQKLDYDTKSEPPYLTTTLETIIDKKLKVCLEDKVYLET